MSFDEATESYPLTLGWGVPLRSEYVIFQYSSSSSSSSIYGACSGTMFTFESSTTYLELLVCKEALMYICYEDGRYL